MAVGTVTKLNQLESILFDTGYRQWNDSTAGNIMFCLVDNTYTPAATHSTTSNLGASLITVGDGATRVAATSLVIDASTTPGTTYFKSDNVNFGATVTITAKYLVCVQPVTANSFSTTTSKLLWYVDLDTTSASSQVASTASPFIVYMPTNGWFKSS